ncbi:phosphonate ABC transporter, permease protein PhnE [Salipaludibacillus aurantiacus]|uniref:Phosphonate transport system permease protein n=1 Tax=Salipaludibacillus aurantiacus TaxID=1601833 RepID=A0A1H9WS55_9BACI|nr:phosphonate ABC transporter, permease protein PhnE [Salipaludibacillus aurantiacus]SES36762.1 phosphonate transport system permease protein [Salipaludibacillus aurantiacus]
MSSLAKQIDTPVEENKVPDMYKDLQRRKKVILKNRLVLWAIIAALVTWAWTGTNFSIAFIYTGTANMAAFIFTDLLPPDFSAFGRYLQPALQTVYMSLVGMVISVIFSIFFGFMAAKNTSFHPAIAFTSRAIIAFLRAIPALIWGITLVVAFGLGPLAGTLALGLSGIGILGKAFADVLEEIDQGQVDAVKATGASWFQTMGQGVWPQFKTGFVAWSLYKMDLNIREAAVLGLIGAGGIGYTLQGNINLFQYQQASVGILMIFALILIVEYTTAKIRERLL